jgi:hypothetical protein
MVNWKSGYWEMSLLTNTKNILGVGANLYEASQLQMWLILKYIQQQQQQQQRQQQQRWKELRIKYCAVKYVWMRISIYFFYLALI